MQTVLNKVIAGLHEFYAHETFLLEKEAGERALTHRLAVHFERQFPGWETDCEYDRLGDRTLRLPRGTIVSTDDHLAKVHLSRHRGAPARHSQQFARGRGPEIGQSSAARP